MRMHRDASYEIDAAGIKGDLLDAAQRAWDEAVELGEEHGYRNAQATVLAPTGTISFLMDCDTTGIEPDFSLVKFKELVGGGQMTIVNRSVPLALRTLGYSEPEVEQIDAYINEKATIVGAPGLKDEHLPVFDVAVGERAISHIGHIDMMAATQPFISGAISKTVNLPRVGDGRGHRRRLHPGLEGRPEGAGDLPRRLEDGAGAAHRRRREEVEPEADEAVASRGPSAGGCRASASRSPTSSRSPATRATSPPASTRTARSARSSSPTSARRARRCAGMMNAFATAISIGLQYGVPLEVFVRKFSYMRFDPEGITNNPEIPFAKSMPDYIMRWLASRFIDDTDELEDLGILTPEVRARTEAQQTAARRRHRDRRAGQRRQRRQRQRPRTRATASGGSGRRHRGAHRHPAGRPGEDVGPRPRPGLRAVRRHDAAHGLAATRARAAATTPAAARPQRVSSRRRPRLSGRRGRAPRRPRGSVSRRRRDRG